MAVVFVAATLIGCQDAEKKQMQKDYSDMVAETSLLRKDLDSRDQYIDQIMKTVNQIYVSLERSKSKEAKLLRSSRDVEGKPKLTQEQIRKEVLNQLYVVGSDLRANGRKIADLERKINKSAIKYANLDQLVGSLKSSVAEREQSISSLETRIKNLEGTIADKDREIGEKNAAIEANDSTIEGQRNRMNTVYYIAGTRDELREKGVISKEGGFLWGLLGSTTVLSANVDSSDFKPIDFTQNPSIHVDGKVEEILPKRSPGSFQLAQMGSNEGYVMIKKPHAFWREKYLVIVLD
ncbi:MAG TPA: hypothetical protein VMM58_06640 [Bacteroidota bacterium]|nr:hypothetical protein [Bacteroidota bacterium]